MDLANYFPIWNKLTTEQQQRLESVTHPMKAAAGTVIHNGQTDCLGLLLIRSGQLRVYTLSDEGREITLYRLFEMDICLFSASCVMPSVQFEVIVEAEKDAELWVICFNNYPYLNDISPIGHPFSSFHILQGMA